MVNLTKEEIKYITGVLNSPSIEHELASSILDKLSVAGVGISQSLSKRLKVLEKLSVLYYGETVGSGAVVEWNSIVPRGGVVGRYSAGPKYHLPDDGRRGFGETASEAVEDAIDVLLTKLNAKIAAGRKEGQEADKLAAAVKEAGGEVL